MNSAVSNFLSHHTSSVSVPPNEKEISHGRVRWQTPWTYFVWGRWLHRLVELSRCAAVWLGYPIENIPAFCASTSTTTLSARKSIAEYLRVVRDEATPSLRVALQALAEANARQCVGISWCQDSRGGRELHRSVWRFEVAGYTRHAKEIAERRVALAGYRLADEIRSTIR